jgi:excisionase family DNA binding protein
MEMAVVTVYNLDDVLELIKHTGISKTSLYRAVATKKLKAVKIGKRYLVSEKALNEFLEGSTEMQLND